MRGVTSPGNVKGRQRLPTIRPITLFAVHQKPGAGQPAAVGLHNGT